MPNDHTVDNPLNAAPGKPLAPAARRALEEAQARRAEAEESGQTEHPRELLGRKGLDPVRYGDWEVRGLATDF
jgi:hypothetical protein